jgi:hypothetical protein
MHALLRPDGDVAHLDKYPYRILSDLNKGYGLRDCIPQIIRLRAPDAGRGRAGGSRRCCGEGVGVIYGGLVEWESRGRRTCRLQRASVRLL